MKDEEIKAPFFDTEKEGDKTKLKIKNVPILAKEHLNIVAAPRIAQGYEEETQAAITQHYNENCEYPNIANLLNIGGIETKHGLYLQGIEHSIFAVLYIKAFNEYRNEIYDIKKNCLHIPKVNRENDYSRGITLSTTINITELTKRVYGYRNERTSKDIEIATMRMINRWVSMPKTDDPNEREIVTFQPMIGMWVTNRETKERTLTIEFRKLYTFNIHHNFVLYPENIILYYRYIASQYISSGFEINIFHKLYSLMHYIKDKTRNPFKIEKAKLYDAVINFEQEKNYFKKHPDRREKRFLELILKFAKTRFLLIGKHTDTEGKEIEDFGYWETKNKDGQTICNFNLNFDFPEYLNSEEILSIIQDKKIKLYK